MIKYIINLKSATKPLNVLIACTRPLITEFADNLNLKHPLLPKMCIRDRANRVSLSGELYKDNWIGKRATEAANSIARERNLVQSKDICKANREEIKQAMDSVLTRVQGFDLAGFSRELGTLGFKVREALSLIHI